MPYMDVRGREKGVLSETTFYVGGGKDGSFINPAPYGARLDNEFRQAYHIWAYGAREKEGYQKPPLIWAGLDGVPANMPTMGIWGREEEGYPKS